MLKRLWLILTSNLIMTPRMNLRLTSCVSRHLPFQNETKLPLIFVCYAFPAPEFFSFDKEQLSREQLKRSSRSPFPTFPPQSNHTDTRSLYRAHLRRNHRSSSYQRIERKKGRRNFEPTRWQLKTIQQTLSSNNPFSPSCSSDSLSLSHNLSLPS